MNFITLVDKMLLIQLWHAYFSICKYVMPMGNTNFEKTVGNIIMTFVS